MSVIAGRKGKLAPAFPRELGRLRDYLSTDLPAPPPGSWGYGLTDSYGMALNDTYGDCTIAGKVHLDEVIASILGQPYTYPGDEAVLAGYCQLLGCSVDQLEADPQHFDTGLNLATVIKAWSSPAGFLGTRIVGAATIELRDWSLVSTALYNFGALYVGIECPASIDQQFSNGTYWHLTNPPADLEGGHCVVLNGESSVETSSGLRPDLRLVTWGREFAMTENFWRTYGDECWVVIPEQMAQAGHDAVGALDLSAMQADIAALHGAK